ncbi:glycogen debranching protein GlgX [Glaciecola sp. 1036]|uniref:glycogen debranching protein GlgX n=1 Tax=Alteromonadaceae TaxID=72275 RepID=UPI003D03F74A
MQKQTSTQHQLVKGHLHPLGATLTARGCNFSIYCPDAAQVFICLFDPDENEIAQVALTQRIQSKWFGEITNVKEGDLYGIRVTPKPHKHNIGCSKEKLLIDPYAKQLNRPLHWEPSLYEGDSSQMVPKAIIIDPLKINAKPVTCSVPEPSSQSIYSQRVVYEAHVKGLSKLHPEVPEDLRGTYLGACHPAIIKHLQQMGVTTIQFLPIMAFMPEPFLFNKKLTNYWGYNPINFFAPEPRYAIKDAVKECYEMISSFKQAGIEVILDVVFNHTAEAGADGPVLSFKGLCCDHAYLIEHQDESDTPSFDNYSGCGNTIKVSDTYMMNLIIDAMRYWVNTMGVAGFRFDLAATLGREVFDFRNNATFFKIIQQDPLLNKVMLIAEPWDIGPGGYQLGQFPATWHEVNDKFRDTVRGFWRGDKGLKGDFATRLMGSRDIFKKTKRPMLASINNVTYHDGFTLHDLVSYEHKHNDANLENNRDGHNHNLSANYGIEGDTDDKAILDVRFQQKRNLFATLVLSQGSVHLLGGDELSKTQRGNNNAYCQDNSMNYLHWDLKPREHAFLDYCRYVIALRKQYPLLQIMHFDDDQFANNINVKFADWYRRDGSHKTDIDWVNHEHHCFALHLVGNASVDKQEWLFCFNSAVTAKEYSLPPLQESKNWSCVLDTSKEHLNEMQNQSISSSFEMPARSFKLLLKLNS